MSPKTDRLHVEVAGLNAVIERLSPQSYGRDSMQRLHTAAKALRDLTNAQPPGETPAQRFTRVQKSTERFRELVARAKQGLLVDELGGIASLSEQRAQALGMVPDKYATQIADAFGKADQATRISWLQRAAETGDGRTLAAIAEAPDFVSGIDRAMFGRFMQLAESKHAPHIAERRERFAEDTSSIKCALMAAETIAHKAINPDELRAALESADAAQFADAAEQALSDATA